MVNIQNNFNALLYTTSQLPTPPAFSVLSTTSVVHQISKSLKLCNTNLHTLPSIKFTDDNAKRLRKLSRNLKYFSKCKILLTASSVGAAALFTIDNLKSILTNSVILLTPINLAWELVRGIFIPFYFRTDGRAAIRNSSYTKYFVAIASIACIAWINLIMEICDALYITLKTQTYTDTDKDILTEYLAHLFECFVNHKYENTWYRNKSMNAYCSISEYIRKKLRGDTHTPGALNNVSRHNLSVRRDNAAHNIEYSSTTSGAKNTKVVGGPLI